MKVMIGTPALDGRVEAWYVDSLVRTVREGCARDIYVTPLMLINESILPMARNEIVRYALAADVDALVFIDSDQAWDPECFFAILDREEDVVGVPVVNKADEEGYNVNPLADESGELIEVYSVGTGFLKLSRRVLDQLWAESPIVHFRGKDLANVFEYRLEENAFVGEDIGLCRKLRGLGHRIFVDTRWTCIHIGKKVWVGDYASYLLRTQGKTLQE